MAMPTTFNTTMPNNLCYKTENCIKTEIFQPKYLSRLYISKDVVFYFTYNKPNMWWRFWQYIILGWRWEDYK